MFYNHALSLFLFQINRFQAGDSRIEHPELKVASYGTYFKNVLLAVLFL
jgi:hypothetical protein